MRARRHQLGASEVPEALHPLILERGAPTHLRSGNGPEFVAEPRQSWLKRVGIQPIQILSGSPWENGYNERFNGTLRREALNAELFATTRQVQIVIDQWLRQYNHIRPHQALAMRPPIPETIYRTAQKVAQPQEALQAIDCSTAS